MAWSVYDEFAGIGGTSHGAEEVPGVEVTNAANHDADAIEQHANNFPRARHWHEDVTKLVMEKMPYADLFSSSPACPAWTDANGVKRDFDKVNAIQEVLPGFDPDSGEEIDPKLAKRLSDYRRSRLLMHEVIRYLRGMIDRDPHNPVKAGMVENVIQCRLWSEWDAWIGEFHKMGYKTRLIALNAMHARPVRARRSAQSRDRLFLAYWHESLGRDPDWDKWLRPKAYCDNCCTIVDAIQVFKKAGVDMGRYGRHGQYVYRCPQRACRGRQVFPEVLPALAAIDLHDVGTRIGDRPKHKMPDLADTTLARISAGMAEHWGPLLTPVGGTWRGDGAKGAVPLERPAPARTTRETDGVAFPPLLVPVEGRPGKNAAPATDAARTMTTRNETGVMLPGPVPLLTSLRGGGCKDTAKTVLDAAGTVSAQGNHHGLAVHPQFQLLMRNNTSRNGESRCTPVTEEARTITANGKQSLVTWADQLLVPIANVGPARTLSEPSGAQHTKDRYGIAVTPEPVLHELPDLDDVFFRMLNPREIGRLMGFADDFRNEAKSKRVQVKLFGNAVVAACAEVIFSALVECISGETLVRESYELAA